MIIETANRLKSVKEYYFSRKLKAIRKFVEEGRDIINLGIGNPDLMPSQESIDQLIETASQNNTHGYQSYVGIPKFRQAISEWYQRTYAVELSADNEILPLIGSKEGIMHISMAFLNKGDKVLVPNPGYLTYSSVSNLVEAETLVYELDAQNNWQPNWAQLETLPLDEVKIMWVNYPNMPTGANASFAVFEKLVAFAKKHKILLVNDNPYSLILNEHPMSIHQVEGSKEVALELNSLSKSHNMAGWRIGMLSGAADHIQAVLKVKSNMDSGMFRGLQEAAIKALGNTKEWHQTQNAIYQKRRKICERILEELQCPFDVQQTGLFLWAKIPDWAENGEKFSDYILDNTDVFITPGFIFGSAGERYLRISLCAKEERLEEALQRVRLLFAIA